MKDPSATVLRGPENRGVDGFGPDFKGTCWVSASLTPVPGLLWRMS